MEVHLVELGQTLQPSIFDLVINFLMIAMMITQNMKVSYNDIGTVTSTHKIFITGYRKIM